MNIIEVRETDYDIVLFKMTTRTTFQDFAFFSVYGCNKDTKIYY